MYLPEDEDISCNDFENMILNPDEMKLYLKKLKDSCANFDAKVERNILQSISKSSECANQVEKNYETISQLSNQKKELKAAIENLKLEQKVIEKKAINRMKEIEKTKTDIESIKERKEKLMLEIVDLKQESEKSNEHMKKQWDAVKKACRMYKNVLDIHIDTEMIDHIEHVTVTFFWSENPTDHKYFIVLTYQDNCWKVKKIEPELSMENKYQLNRVVQFSKQSEVANVTLLLCELRKLFLKNYFEK
ncbi:hypothetical protein TSAR_008718 [Trichomalopsis sarcophagae]|uniref:Kinetochore protein SPC25 n=1 Tax=Trichomalopsis sarcophagae TaxID=543379 RepID=A0A232EH74_9HYME|nr:hypothetical protein TSAR_008718 [Trichomalopsis sarcophagae]